MLAALTALQPNDRQILHEGLQRLEQSLNGDAPQNTNLAKLFSQTASGLLEQGSLAFSEDRFDPMERWQVLRHLAQLAIFVGKTVAQTRKQAHANATAVESQLLKINNGAYPGIPLRGKERVLSEHFTLIDRGPEKALCKEVTRSNEWGLCYPQPKLDGVMKFGNRLFHLLGVLKVLLVDPAAGEAIASLELLSGGSINREFETLNQMAKRAQINGPVYAETFVKSQYQEHSALLDYHDDGVQGTWTTQHHVASRPVVKNVIVPAHLWLPTQYELQRA